MFKKLSLTAVALAMSVGTIVPATAQAQRYYGDRYERGYDQREARAYDRRAERRYARNRHNDGRRYNDGRRCSGGTTGTIVGAIAGGLLGRSIDTRGDRAAGTIIGGVGGAVAGNAIERSGNPRYCR